VIQISDMGLADMDTAVATIFHEIYHRWSFSRMGNEDVGGKESVAERFGQRMLGIFKKRTGG
jgi:hypothetical protein